MRTVKQLPIGTPQSPNTTRFPNGGVINETSTTKGTPIVEEIIGDILTNSYAILEAVKITPNGEQDGADTQYQLLEALRRLTNTLNDSEQPLTLSGLVFSVPLNLSLFPEKYFLFAKTNSNYISSNSYTFKGNGSGAEDLTFNFTSNGFKTGDELLLIIGSDTVVAYNLSGINSNAKEVFTVLGTPLSFNDSEDIWYQSNGVIFNDKPESFNLEIPVTSLYGVTCFIYETIIFKGFAVCLVFNTITSTYTVVKLSLSNLNVATEVNLIGLNFPSGVNNNPFMYSDGDKIYFTNNCGNGTVDGVFTSFVPDSLFNNLTYSTTSTLSSFVKSTNMVIKNNYAYSLISNELNQYNVSSGVKVFVNTFVGFIGVLFNFKKEIYYSNGEVSKKWTLPIYS